MIRKADITAFQAVVWDHYRRLGRHDLPWRHNVTPYHVLVSEVMLQQTQVSRVLVKYPEWLERFPSFETLAAASTKDVLAAWQGMGYNRRALYLQRAAQMVMSEFGGQLPDDEAALYSLPGVGAGTAGSIVVFAFDQPAVFIETNIRRVFIHHFFADAERVSDKDLLPLIEAVLDHGRPRKWYWALMDYGVWLAGQATNPNRRSRHYAKQSKFEGSARQLRGEILRRLLAGPKSLEELPDDERLPNVLAGLVKEGFIVAAGEHYLIH